MCRSIKPLFNYQPPASAEEIRAAALQFVRKVAGTTRPSQVNEPAFELAVTNIATAVEDLLDGLTTNAPARDRAVEAARARQRAQRRFGAA